jgi:hypothetical protein
MSLHRGVDGSEPVRPEPITRLGGSREERRDARTFRLAEGTLACPDCDAPVAPDGSLRPAEPIACPYCRHAGAVRDFLSLGAPTRPARVEVRVTARAAGWAARAASA